MDCSRHIPAAVRDAVFARDGGRCTYVGEHGVPCESRHNLHVDHVEPFARGGPPTAGNLRLLCAAHNQLEAERVYGSEWMRRFRGGGNDLSLPRFDGHLEQVGYSHREVFDGEAEVHS